MKKKLLAILLTLAMGLSMTAPAAAETEDIPSLQAEQGASTGKTGGANWTYDGNGTLEILSTDYNNPLNISGLSFASEVTALVIDEGITTIGSSAFDGFTNLKEVTIPVGMTDICYKAFSACSSLETVHYEGTHTQWNAIRISYGNKNLRAASAFTAQASGSWSGRHVNWSIDGTTLRVSGSDSIEADEKYTMEIGAYAVPWAEYWDYIETVYVGAQISGVEALLSANGQSATSVKEIIFQGEVPAVFLSSVPACQIYYPEVCTSWTEEFRSSYSAATWTSYCSVKDGAVVTAHTPVYGALQINSDGMNYPTLENTAFREGTCSACGLHQIKAVACIHGIDAEEHSCNIKTAPIE